jgi:Tfp pilus assembly protein PilV
MKMRAKKGLNACGSKASKTVSERGFTLIETAIALCVMMIASLAAASLFAYAINYNSGANDRAMALAIAQQRMERLRKSAFTETSLTTASLTEAVTSVGRNYSVLTTICPQSSCGGSATLKMITVQVTPQGASQWANIAMTVISKRSTPTVGQYAAK